MKKIFGLMLMIVLVITMCFGGVVMAADPDEVKVEVEGDGGEVTVTVTGDDTEAGIDVTGNNTSAVMNLTGDNTKAGMNLTGDDANVDVTTIGNDANIAVNTPQGSDIYINGLDLQVIVDGVHGHPAWGSGGLAWTKQRDVVMPWLEALSNELGLTTDEFAEVMLWLEKQESAIQSLSEQISNDMTHELADQESRLLTQEGELSNLRSGLLIQDSSLLSQEWEITILQSELDRLGVELNITEDRNAVRSDELMQIVSDLGADNIARTNIRVEAYGEARTWMFGMAIALLASFVVLLVMGIKLRQYRSK